MTLSSFNLCNRLIYPEKIVIKLMICFSFAHDVCLNTNQTHAVTK